MKKKTIVEFIGSFFILLFAYTALSKLFLQDVFKYSLGMSPLIAPMADVIAWAIPVLELGICALLFFPKTRKIGLYSTLATMIVFTLYISYMIIFTPKLPCSCGGIIRYLTWRQHLVFNIGCIGLAALGIRLMVKKQIPVSHRVKPALS